MTRGSLRGQLTLAYTAALVAGLVIFAGLSLAVLDRSARGTLDQRLLSEARTLTSVIEVTNGKIIIDRTDSGQFNEVIGVKLSGAVYDARGRLLLSTTTTVPSQVHALAQLKEQHENIRTVGPADAQLRVASVPIVEGTRHVGVALLWHSLDSIEDLDRRSALVFGFAIPVIVAFAIFFGTMLAKRGLAPLGRLADLASDIEAHDLSRRLDPQSERDELGRLCATFDRMLDRLEAAFMRERRFTSDASHELRGPLSVIRAEAELALRRTRSPNEYQQTLRTIMSEADALERLTSDLLAAARAQTGNDQDAQGIDLCELVRNVCARLHVLAEARNVRVEVACTTPSTLSANLADLTRVVFAIVHNAIKYSAPQTTVRAAIAQDAGTIVLTVADRGPGFSADALAHAFDRFWRDDTMRAREGSGLGLSIAQHIVTAMNGTIELSNASEGAGAVVELRLPPGVSP